MNIDTIFNQDRIILHPDFDDKLSLLQKLTDKTFPNGDNAVESYRLAVDANAANYSSLSHCALLFFFETSQPIEASGSLAILRETIDWDESSKNIALVFVIVYSKDEPKAYLDFLSQLSRMLSRKANCERLLNAHSSAEAWEVFVAENVQKGRSGDRRKNAQPVSEEKRMRQERRE